MSLDFNIVTLHRAENYGAILQAYALQEFLKINGYTVGVYDSIQVKAPRNKSLKAIISRIYSLRDIVHQKEYKNKRRKFSVFLNENININMQKDAKVFLAGSDQIWNPIVFNSDFYLQFVDNKSIKASYAASIGVSNIPFEKYLEYKKMLNNFDQISVREKDAQMELQKILGCERGITQNIDPVFLLSKEMWIKKSLESKMKIEGDYVLLYILHIPKNITKICDWAKKEYNCKLVLIGQKGTIFHKIPSDMIVRDVGPCDFLALFRDSRAVITTSFHGTAFSVIFEKEFYSIVNPSSPSRVSNILSIFDIHMISESDEVFDKQQQYYGRKIIEREQKESKTYFSVLYSRYKEKENDLLRDKNEKE